MNMEHICKICHEDSTSHSFSKLCEIKGVSVFYTKPADATKYTDTEGILAHYDNMLKHNGDKPWTWIFDSNGFGMKHALEINTGIGIAKLITSKYSKNLQKIKKNRRRRKRKFETRRFCLHDFVGSHPLPVVHRQLGLYL